MAPGRASDSEVSVIGPPCTPPGHPGRGSSVTSAELSDPCGSLPTMDAASLLTGLLLGALLATAVTLGVVALGARRRPDNGLEPVHESLDHLHRLLAGMERARATAHGELR